jgi:hypothetical protein
MNVRRGLTRLWTAGSVVWLAVVLLIAGPATFNSAKGLWDARNADRPNVPAWALPRIYYSQPPADVRAEQIRGPDDRIRWVEIDENKNAMWSAIYLDMQADASANFKTLAFITLIPLALAWMALYTGFWIVRGFRGA